MSRNSRLSLITAIVAILSVWSASTFAQPLFESDEDLTLRIEAPLTSLFGELRNADEYVEAKLTATTGGITTTFDIKLKPRGKTRRDKSVCRFPPLTVNFKKKAVAGTVFEGQDKLKLVTHCHSKKSSYDEYYRHEYLIYKTYNALTEESFRVRGAVIDYVDTQGKQTVSGEFGFLIEDADRLANRLGRERRKVSNVPQATYEAKAAARFALFQYLIGNLDWAILGGPKGDNCCHNSKPYFDSQTGTAIPVPYDFDYAGLINAKYAVPPAGIAVKSVRTRNYRGFCIHGSALTDTIALFELHKETLYQINDRPDLLGARTIKTSKKYFDEFYAILADPKKVERKLTNKCR